MTPLSSACVQALTEGRKPEYAWIVIRNPRMIRDFRLKAQKLPHGYISTSRQFGTVWIDEDEVASAHDAFEFSDVNTCVMCGDTIPEGRQICPKCEKKWRIDLDEI